MIPRPWQIDLIVWICTLAVFSTVTVAIVKMNRPPTLAELREERQNEYISQCLGVNTDMNPAMQKAFCNCMNRRVNSGFYLDIYLQRDVAQCRQQAARSLAGAANLETAFKTAFPAACARLESKISGRQVTGNTDFCACIEPRVRTDRAQMAELAFAQGELRENSDLAPCGVNLAVGTGWTNNTVGQFITADLTLPRGYGISTMKFYCKDGILRFSVKSEAGTNIKSSVSITEGDYNAEIFKGGADIDDPDSYQSAIHIIGWQSNPPKMPIVYADTEFNVWNDNARPAIEKVIQQCPRKVDDVQWARPDPSGVNTEDFWESSSDFYATMNVAGQPLGYAGLDCSSTPASLTFAGPFTEEVGRKLVGQPYFSAIENVPVTITAGSAVLLQQTVFCGDMEGGAACPVVLDRKNLEELVRHPVIGISIAGIQLGPIVFGSSSAVRAVLPACAAATQAVPPAAMKAGVPELNAGEVTEEIVLPEVVAVPRPRPKDQQKSSYDCRSNLYKLANEEEAMEKRVARTRPPTCALYRDVIRQYDRTLYHYKMCNDLNEKDIAEVKRYRLHMAKLIEDQCN